MKLQKIKFLLRFLTFACVMIYACFIETDVLTAKALIGLGIFVGLSMMGNQRSTEQKA